MSLKFNPLTGKFDMVRTNAHDLPYTAGESVGDMLDETINSGMVHETTIVDAGGLNITWAASELFDAPNDTEVETDAGSGTCTDNTINYLVWTASGTALTLRTTKADPALNEIGVAEIACQAGDIWSIDKDDILHRRTYEISEALEEMFPVIVTAGLIISEDTDVTNIWDVQLSAGTYYANGHDRNTIASPVLSRTVNMVRWFKSSGVWTNDTNAQIDPTQYNDGTGLTAVAANKYYRSNFFVVGSTIHWIYPDTEYNTLAQALEGVCPTIPPGLERSPRLTCLVLKGNDAALPAAGSEQWMDVRPRIGSSIQGSSSSHNSLADLQLAQSSVTYGHIDDQAQTIAGAKTFSSQVILTAGLNLSDGNITNVGDIALDSISSDAGTSINVVLGSDAGDDFTVDTNKLVVEGDSGNVGIGITSPVSLTHIYQNDSAIGNETGLTIEQDGTGDAMLQFLLTGARRWTFGIDNSDSDILKISSTADLGSGTHWSLDTSGNMYVQGDVGIGAASPNALLQIEAATTADFNITNTGSGVSYFRMQSNRTASDTSIGILDAEWDGTTIARIAFRAGVDTTNKDDGYFAFYTAEGGSLTEKMRLAQNGNVGIGVADPSHTLVIGEDLGSMVTGNALVIGDSTDHARLIMGEDNNNRFVFSWITSGYALMSIIESGTVYNNILVMRGGNVGIGTASPASKLEIDGGVNVGGTGAIADNDIYIVDNCSADSFTDRTPYYEGDALAEIAGIVGYGETGSMKVDHSKLPVFAQKEIVRGVVVDGLQKLDGNGEPEMETVIERDLGAMISIHTVGIQQLIAENTALKARITILEKA